MRRILAIWLLMVLGLPVVSPLLASTTETDAAVPVCCRKGGAHHCLGSMAATGLGQKLSVAAPRCAEFPKAVASSHANDFFLMAPTPAFAEDVTLPSGIWQAEARARVALDRARHKRGPPTAGLLALL